MLTIHLNNGAHQPICGHKGKGFYKLTQDPRKSNCAKCTLMPVFRIIPMDYKEVNHDKKQPHYQ